MSLILKIVPDPDPDPVDPRDYDTSTKLVLFHKRYNLAHELPINQEDYSGWDEMEADIIDRYTAVTVPVYMYDHSGITLSTSPFSCPWDSGQVGFCVFTREAILNHFGGKRLTRGLIAQARNVIEAEVKEYSAYLEGDCWGYVIEEDGEVVDSCWGFQGEETAREEGEFQLKRIKEAQNV